MVTAAVTREAPLITREATLERAHSARQYIRNAYSGLMDAQPSAYPKVVIHHADDTSYAQVNAVYQVQTTNAAHDEVLRDYVEQLSDHPEYAQLSQWLVYPFLEYGLTFRQTIGTTLSVHRREYKQSVHLTGPLSVVFHGLSDTTVWGANTVLWTDLVEHHAVHDILSKINVIVRDIGVRLDTANMYFARPFILAYLMGLAHDAESHMMIPFDPERPIAWQQGVYVQAYRELLAAREQELVQLLRAAVIATHKQR